MAEQRGKGLAAPRTAWQQVRYEVDFLTASSRARQRCEPIALAFGSKGISRCNCPCTLSAGLPEIAGGQVPGSPQRPRGLGHLAGLRAEVLSKLINNQQAMAPELSWRVCQAEQHGHDPAAASIETSSECAVTYQAQLKVST